MAINKKRTYTLNEGQPMKKLQVVMLIIISAVAGITIYYSAKSRPDLSTLKYELSADMKDLAKEKEYFNNDQKKKVTELLSSTVKVTKGTRIGLSMQNSLASLRSELESLKNPNNDFKQAYTNLEAIKFEIKIYQEQMEKLGKAEIDYSDSYEYLKEIQKNIDNITSSRNIKNPSASTLNNFIGVLPESIQNIGQISPPPSIPKLDFPEDKTSYIGLEIIEEAHAELPFGCQTAYQATAVNENPLLSSYLNINDPLIKPNPRILDLARKLGTPKAMFEYVRDNVKYYPTVGFTQDAETILSTKVANPYDKSTLLISLLRSAGVPARYVIGEAWVSSSTLQRIWDVENYSAVWTYYVSMLRQRYNENINTNPGKLYRRINGETYFLFPHTWVEAFTNLRANDEKRWIQLDPGFTLHEENNKHEAINSLYNLSNSLGRKIFSLEDFLFKPDPVSGKFVKTETADLYALRNINAIVSYSKDNNYNWDNRLSTLFTSTRPESKKDIVYGSFGEEFCIFSKPAIPETKYSPKLKFSFAGSSYLMPLFKIASKKLVFRYRGYTTTDKSNLNLLANGKFIGNITNTRVIGQIYINNELIFEAPTPVNFNSIGGLKIENIDTNGMEPVNPPDAWGPLAGNVLAYHNTLTPESQEVFDGYMQSFLNEINHINIDLLDYENKSRLVGDLLATGLIRLKIKQEIHLNNLGNILNAKILTPNKHCWMFSGFTPITFKDRIYGFSPNRPTLSLWGGGGWFSRSRHQESEVDLFNASAFGSQQEHMIMENHFNVPGASTVSILQIASQQGIPIIKGTYNQNNYESIISQLSGYSTWFLEWLRNEMRKSQGLVYIPKTPVISNGIKYAVVYGPMGWRIGTENGGSGGIAVGDTASGFYESDATNGLISSGHPDAAAIASSPKQLGEILNGRTSAQCPESVGAPVNLNNGGMWHKFNDIGPMGNGPGLKASFVRTYLALKSNDFGPLGYGWTHNLHLYLKTFDGSALNINQNQDIFFVDGDGNQRLITYSSNRFVSLPYHNITYAKAGGNFILTDRDFNVMTFHGSGILIGKIRDIRDRNGNTLTFNYNSSSRLSEVRDTDGKTLIFSYLSGRINKVTDFTGRSVSFSYDAQNDLVESTDLLGNKTTYNYYSGLTPVELNHNLKSFKNEKGEGVEYFYYKNDKVFRHIEPEGKVTTFLYNTYNNETIVITGNEERTVYRYDVFGNVVSIENPDHTIRDFKYDLYKNKTYEKDENDFVTKYKSDNRGNITEIIPPAPFGKTIITYDPNFNVPTQVTDGKGNKTIYGVDPENGNVLAIKQYPGGSKELITQIGYNERGELISLIDPKQNAITVDRVRNTDKSQLITITNAEGGTMTREIDPLGRVVSSNDLNGIETTFEYNNLGLLVSNSTPLASIHQTFKYDKSNNLSGVVREIEGKALSSIYKHDGLGNIIEATNERGETYRISYKQSGCGCAEEARPKQIIDPKGGVTKFEHDWRGNVTHKIDPMGIKTKLGHDPRGNLANVTVFNTDESISSQINFVYGALNTLKEKSEVVGYATVLNRNTFKSSDPVKDMIVKTIFNYDPSGNLSEKIITRQPTGEVAKTNYSYNGLNLLTGISSTGYKHNVFKTLSYDDGSNLKEIIHNKAKVVLQYDGFNRPIVVQTIADPTGNLKQPSSSLNYTYTSGGQVTSIKDANGIELVGYELDQLMLPRLVKSGKYSIGIEFDSLGRKKQISYPNKLETDFSFDNLDRLAEINTPNLGFRTYQFDELSNISQIKSESGQLDYAYDRNSSLIGAYYKGSEAINDEKFIWDASGNPLNGSRNPEEVSNRPRPIVINNGLFEDAEPIANSVGRFSFIYDMHGNTIKKFDNQENIYYVFEYDADNKLVYAEKFKDDTLVLKAKYTFDGFGRRIEKEVIKGSIVARKSYIYNGDDILLEYNTTGATPIETVKYIGTGSIDDNLMTIRSSKAFFYHKDHLGSIVSITNDAGELIQKNQYSSFGKILSIKNKDRKEVGVEGAVEKSFAYTGREWDEEIDLYYYRARHYDPQIGRFLQKDPIGLSSGDTNVYRYVLNQPNYFSDPYGLDLYLGNTQQVKGLHQKIAVDTSKGLYGQSFGMISMEVPMQGFIESWGANPGPGLSGSGIVYKDPDPFIKVSKVFQTTKEEDKFIESYLKSQIGFTGPYNVLSNNCRDYSQTQFETIVNIINERRGN